MSRDLERAIQALQDVKAHCVTHATGTIWLMADHGLPLRLRESRRFPHGVRLPREFDHETQVLLDPPEDKP